MRATITWILPYIGMIILALLLFRQCESQQEESNRYQDNMEALHSEVKTITLKNGQLASEKKLLSVTNDELQKQVWIRDDSILVLLEKLKNPVVVIRWKTEYKIPPGYVPFEEPVPFDFSRTFSKLDPWYSLSGTVTQNGVTFDSIRIPNIQRLVVAYKKGKPVVRVSNSNPYIQVQEMEGQVIEIKRKRWGVGPFVGANYLLNPTFGVGVHYDLFQF